MHQPTSTPALQTGAAFDVIVVGARAAGAATAMLLARSGLDVLVLERGALGADTLSTHAIMRGGVLQLSRWGVLDDIVAAGTPPVKRTTFSYSDASVVIDIMRTHPMVIIGGILQENPFYVPPDEMLRELAERGTRTPAA